MAGPCLAILLLLGGRLTALVAAVGVMACYCFDIADNAVRFSARRPNLTQSEGKEAGCGAALVVVVVEEYLAWLVGSLGVEKSRVTTIFLPSWVMLTTSNF